MGKLFGTDGIRGIANVEPMTVETAMRVGRGIAYLLKNSQRRPKVLIGKDTRLSGYMLENALTAGICSMGADIFLVGPLPTPGISFMTVSMRADAGVVISASHNPFPDNGIKLFSKDGFKFPEHLEEKIEELIFSPEIYSLCPTATEIGKAYRIDDAIGRYVVFLKNTFPKDLTLDGLKIVLDCAHGAAYKVAPAVLEELGADLITIGVEPNGENINLNCGSLYPEVIGEAVKKQGADLGIALDGDADRVIFVDEKGQGVDGDQVMAICALEMINSQRLNKNTLVTTIMSNLGLDLALKKAGGRVIKTGVGDRYVVEEMLKGGYNLGGEQSGHLVFLDYNTTCDGILSASQLLAIMKRKEKKLSELAQVMNPFPQIIRNVKVKNKEEDILQVPEIASEVKRVEEKLGSSGRVVVRFSGTEPLLRIMIEGEDYSEITTLAEEIAEKMERFLSPLEKEEIQRG